MPYLDRVHPLTLTRQAYRDTHLVSETLQAPHLIFTSEKHPKVEIPLHPPYLSSVLTSQCCARFLALIFTNSISPLLCFIPGGIQSHFLVAPKCQRIIYTGPTGFCHWCRDVETFGHKHICSFIFRCWQVLVCLLQLFSVSPWEIYQKASLLHPGICYKTWCPKLWLLKVWGKVCSSSNGNSLGWLKVHDRPKSTCDPKWHSIG